MAARRKGDSRQHGEHVMSHYPFLVDFLDETPNPVGANPVSSRLTTLNFVPIEPPRLLAKKTPALKRPRRRRKTQPKLPTTRQQEIANAVVTHNGNQTAAAKSLRISRQEVGQQLKAYMLKLET